MEQMDYCANIDAVHTKEKNSLPRKLKTDHGMKAEDSSRHKLSAPCVYFLLGLIIMLSAAALGIAVILFIGNVEKAIAQLFKLQTEIPRQRESVLTCREEWTKFKQSCYHFSSSSNTWVEAQRSCASADAHLVVINNAEEQSFLKKTINIRRWIGLSDSASEGDWRWVDGTDYNSTVKFWYENEPNNDYGVEHCGEMIVDVDGRRNGCWNDYPCGNKQKWICEKPTE